MPKRIRLTVAALLVASGIATFGASAPPAHAQALPPLLAGKPAVADDRLDIGTQAACAALGSGQVACAGKFPVPDGNTDRTAVRSYTTPAIDAIGAGVGGVDLGCYLKGSGSVNCWGYPSVTGTGSNQFVYSPNQPVLGVSGAVEVDTGDDLGCARLQSGTARCWGYGSNGERGDATTDLFSAGLGSAPLVDADTNAPLSNIGQVSMADLGGCALIADGTVKCWGANSQHRLVAWVPNVGPNTLTKATSVAGLANVNSLSLNTNHACALITDGTVKCWGNSSTANRLPSSVTNVETPTTVPGLSGARMVATGFSHSCALLSDATVSCWGLNSVGQLGRPIPALNATTYFDPAVVPGLSGVRSIHSGRDDMCAVLFDGTVRCWGANANGELGIAGINIATPTDVPLFAWGGRFTPLNPARILDTRSGTKPAAGSTTTVTVRGQGGVPASANGVLVNVTVDAAEAGGFASVTPCTAGVPSASNLNYSAGDTIPNLVAAPLTADGKICIYTSARAHLLADVAGYYDATGSNFTGLTPQRILDTRTGVGAPAAKVAASGRVDLQVIGAATGVPSNATGIVLNVKAVDAAGGGYITVFPCTVSPPNASNLNFTRVGQTIPNLVAMPLSASGKVCFFTSAGVHLLADVAGYFAPTGPAFAPVDPKRLLDTRTGVGAAAGKLGAGQTLTLRVRGIVNGAPANAEAVVLNITAVDPSADGYLTVYPCGTRPDASNLNFTTGRNIPNLVMMPLSATGDICIFASAATHILADINGHYRPQ